MACLMGRYALSNGTGRERGRSLRDTRWHGSVTPKRA
jgi:hypothetical protein